MAVAKKNYDWIDSIRVLSTLHIIVFHYIVVFLENPTFKDGIYTYFMGIGHFGIAAFFGISGYLVVSSLERSKSILDFYRRKIIRVILPFIVTYILALIALVSLKFLSAKFNLFHINAFDSTPVEIIFGMFPFDLNILKFLDISYLFLVGEWFVGVIIWLYLLSPLIYKFLKINIPATMIVSIIIAGITANFFQDFEAQGRIFAVQTIFLVRLPEFAIGMALFMCRDKIFQTIPKITTVILIAAMVLYTSMQNIEVPGIWLKYYFGNAIDIHFVLAAVLSVYFSFIAADFMNKNCKKVMAKINNFKDISYMAILIQHLVIHLFDKMLDFEHMGILSAIFFFFVIMAIIIILSQILKIYYTPFEKKLLN